MLNVYTWLAPTGSTGSRCGSSGYTDAQFREGGFGARAPAIVRYGTFIAKNVMTDAA